MFPKSPTRQMYPNPGQQPYTPYPIPQLPPMAQKKKGFLAKLLKNTIQPSRLCKWFHLTDKWKGNQ